MARDEKLAARLKNLGFILALLFIILIARLVELQVIRHEYYSRRAKNQQIDKVTLEADRGTIFDRNGVPLAVSRDVYSLYADPQRIQDPGKASREIAKVLGVSSRGLEKKFRSARDFEWIARRVSLSTKRKICEKHIEGISYRLEKGRHYPGGSLLAQLLGFCGVDNIGRWGLEEELDSYLKGTDGWVYMVRDACGKRFVDLSLPKKTPVKGCDVILTIDSRLQEIVEMVLERTVREMRAEGGTIVIVDPVTGDVLAMASSPTVDLYKLWPPIDESVYRMLRNRATMEVFEPGSTFKLITMASLLENGTVRPDELVFCENGSYRVNGRTIADSHPEHWLSVKEVFSKSSNIGMSKLIERLSESSLMKTIKEFGIGSPTGLDFVPEEKGLLNQPGDGGWSGYSMQSLSYGQEVSVTALQMTMAYSAVANGGELLVPCVVKEIRGPVDIPVWTSRRKVLWNCISRETTLVLKDFLTEVVSTGTGTRAALGSIPVAGKTGTAQKAFPGRGYVDGKYVSSFGGFFPVDSPGVVIFVAIDEPQEKHYGGEVAAPAFRDIIEYMMLSCPDVIDPRTLAGMGGIESAGSPGAEASHGSFVDSSTGFGTALLMVPVSTGMTPVTAANEKAVIVPDLSGFSARDAMQHIRSLGLIPVVSGSGFVFGQIPPAGSVIQRGERCELKCAFMGGNSRAGG